MRILIVEDQVIVIKTLSNIILEQFPEARIKSTSDTDHVLSILRDLKVDLIVSDLDFNGEKRFYVVALAKELGIKCIVYSAYYNMAFIKKAKELSVAAFVSKLGKLEDLEYAIKNYRDIENYICSYCEQQNRPNENIEILFPELTPIEVIILDQLLIQIPRKQIAKDLKITSDSLNTYINRMTAKNNCNLLALTHRYIVWKRSNN